MDVATQRSPPCNHTDLKSTPEVVPLDEADVRGFSRCRADFSSR